MALIKSYSLSIDTLHSIRILYMTDSRASFGERAFAVRFTTKGEYSSYKYTTYICLTLK